MKFKVTNARLAIPLAGVLVGVGVVCRDNVPIISGWLILGGLLAAFLGIVFMWNNDDP